MKMKKSSKKWFALMGGLVVLGICLSSSEVQARPQYNKAFTEAYPKLADAAKQAKCGLCHGEKKTDRNDYGKAVGGGLTQKNEKDAEAISKALKKAEEGKSKSGKTFKEMIEAGDLPK